MQGAILSLGRRIDAMVAQQSTPPMARQGWETVKRVLGQAADATDVNRYVQGAPLKKGQ